MCKECEKRGKTWSGSDPVCAFPMNYFSIDNFECATIGILRDYMEEEGNIYRDSDESLGIISYHNMFLVLTWYKNRGRVQSLTIFNRYLEYLDMTDLEICEEIITNKINVLSEDK